MSLVGRIIKAIGLFVTNLIKSLSSKAKELIPIAITIVNAIKFAVENPITGNLIDFILDAVKKAIPGELDDKLIDKIKAMIIVWLPKILERLKVAEGIANIEDQNEKWLAILKELQGKDAEEKALFYNDAAVTAAVELTDESLTLKKALITVPLVYQNPEVLNV